MSIKVYIAGSSDDLPRVKAAMAAATAAGLTVVSTWVGHVEKAGDGNPRWATNEQRWRWASTDLDGVGDSDVIWLLFAPKFGAGAEWGYARAMGKIQITSGDTKRSIFCALGHEFETDEAALAFLLTIKERKHGQHDARQFDTSDVRADAESTPDAPATPSGDAAAGEHAVQAFRDASVVKR